MRYKSVFLAAAALAALWCGVSSAADQANFWTTPTIEGYGKMHYLPDAAYRPQPDQTYKIVFALSQGVKSPTDVNMALWHVARAVNLYAASGVPLDHLKFVAVAYTDARRPPDRKPRHPLRPRATFRSKAGWDSVRRRRLDTERHPAPAG